MLWRFTPGLSRPPASPPHVDATTSRAYVFVPESGSKQQTSTGQSVRHSRHGGRSNLNDAMRQCFSDET
jgi:hypothetical protein